VIIVSTANDVVYMIAARMRLPHQRTPDLASSTKPWHSYSNVQDTFYKV